jgi:hypothetical protein
MQTNYMSHGEGFLLVYSIDSHSSFEELAQLYEQMLRVKDSFPMIVVGTKCDLEFQRQVPTGGACRPLGPVRSELTDAAREQRAGHWLSDWGVRLLRPLPRSVSTLTRHSLGLWERLRSTR